MKLKHPRYSIAFNLLSILGWISAFLLTKMYKETIDPSRIEWFFYGTKPFIIVYIECLMGFILTYGFENLFDIQIHNFRLPENKVYSLFFEFGFFLYLFPIVWNQVYYNHTLLPILYLIYSYILLKIIIAIIKKLVKKIKSKK